MFSNHDTFKTTLEAIAKLLNANNITWCIGASGSLYVQGVAVTPKDLDIIVDKSQFDKAYEVLKELHPSEREEGEFGGDKYYKAELQGTAFPAEIVGFEINKNTLASHQWEGVETTVHPLDYELEMYRKRTGKEHIVTLIEETIQKGQ